MNKNTASTIHTPLPTGLRDRPGRLSCVLYFLLIVLSMTVSTGAMSLILTGAVLLFTLVYTGIVEKKSLAHLRQNLSVPVMGFLGFSVVNGLAAIYSDFGGSAVSEFRKILASFAVTALLLFWFRRAYSRMVLWGFASVSALVGFLGVDAACRGPVFGLFQRLMAALGADYSQINETITSRVNGIYGNSNVTASILALGCLLALCLIAAETAPVRRFAAALLLGCSSMSFFMSVSRGAIVCFAVSLLVWLVAAQPSDRVRLLLLMVFSACTTVILSAAAAPAFGGGSLLPSLLTLACGAVIFTLDQLAGVRLLPVLARHSRASIVLAAILVAGAAVYAVAAVTLSSPLTLDPGITTVRSADLPAGTYTVSGSWDGNPNLKVFAMTRRDTLLGNYTPAYDGPLDGASFSVGDHVVNTRIHLTSPETVQIRNVDFSNGDSLHLGYPLLPHSVSVRLQDGLLHGYNFLQRVQYDRDAWTLWLRSPLIGHGLGSTEGLFTSVQPYFYQSLYAHNHILQVLCDMGLLGGLFFLTMLLGVAWVLVRGVRRERSLTVGMLLSCWVMINTHGLMEINFSVRGYQCFVYPMLMYAAMLYAPPIRERLARSAGILAAAVIWLFMAVFGGLMASHRMIQRQAAAFSTTDAAQFIRTMSDFIRRDVFDDHQLMLDYVANIAPLGDDAPQKLTEDYVRALRQSGTYPACSGLERYYYLPAGDFDALFACSREGIAQEASAKESWNLQLTFYRTEVLAAVTPETYDQFLSGVLATKAYLEEYSADHWEEIVLEEENRVFLERVQHLADQQIGAENGLPFLSGS